MRRFAFWFSMLSAIAIAALWAAAPIVALELRRDTGTARLQCIIANGGICIYRFTGLTTGLHGTSLRVVFPHNGSYRVWWFRAGSRRGQWGLYIPMWAVAGTFLAVAALAYKRPPPAGHCGRCGYSLRGLTARRCPECGADLSLAPGEVQREPAGA